MMATTLNALVQRVVVCEDFLLMAIASTIVLMALRLNLAVKW